MGFANTYFGEIGGFDWSSSGESSRNDIFFYDLNFLKLVYCYTRIFLLDLTFYALRKFYFPLRCRPIFESLDHTKIGHNVGFHLRGDALLHIWYNSHFLQFCGTLSGFYICLLKRGQFESGPYKTSSEHQIFFSIIEGLLNFFLLYFYSSI